MISQFDFAILNFIQDHFRNGFMDMLMKLITSLGNHGILYIAITIGLLLFSKTRKEGKTMAAAQIAGVIICSVILKNVFARVRPFNATDFELIISAPTDFSFPSGHTLHAFITATVLYSSYRKWGIAAYALALVMAFSRMYLYVHYPSDVVAGAIIGFFIGLVAVTISKRKTSI